MSPETLHQLAEPQPARFVGNASRPATVARMSLGWGHTIRYHIPGGGGERLGG
jgi:hypothetical protein